MHRYGMAAVFGRTVHSHISVVQWTQDMIFGVLLLDMSKGCTFSWIMVTSILHVAIVKKTPFPPLYIKDHLDICAHSTRTPSVGTQLLS